MAAKVLHATKDRSGYHFLVHLDMAMRVGSHEAHELCLPEGAPHPHFVRRWDFGHLTPGVHQIHHPEQVSDENPNGLVDMTEEEYLASIEAMLTEQIALELEGIRFYQPAPRPHAIVDALHQKEL